MSAEIKGDITKADVIDLFTELADELTAYADRIDREIELIVRPDGTALLMGGESDVRGGRGCGLFRADCGVRQLRGFVERTDDGRRTAAAGGVGWGGLRRSSGS